jgi:2-C-methyl-D-erythritol 4-phosphate cytidylyltransferase
MGARVPKQYLDLAGRPVIDYSLSLFLDHSRISGVIVALDPADDYWGHTTYANHPRVRRVNGGEERCDSVLNALDLVAGEEAETDRVLVHDAARPCLRESDVDLLLNALSDHPVGGLLGVPVRDTMKRVEKSGAVSCTVSRQGLWHAFTPQMFPLGLLRDALHAAMTRGLLVTDDASAVEMMGYSPQFVEGHADNIKVTRPEDLSLARFFLQQQGR